MSATFQTTASAPPSAQAYGEAGMLAGLVERSRNPREQTHRCDLLNDALIFLQALEQGQVVLTRNIRDFAAFLRFAPAGRVLFYEATRGHSADDRARYVGGCP